jgi:hypothetical protein
MVATTGGVCQVRLALVEPVVDFQVVLQHTAEWLARDKLMIDMLKSIGIEKGKPFNPETKTQDILKSAAREARALLESKYDELFSPYLTSAAGPSRRSPSTSRPRRTPFISTSRHARTMARPYTSST